MIGENPTLFEDLLAGLDEPDAVVRGQTADALEKISRIHPEYFLSKISDLIRIASKDQFPMVRWHAVMILTNLLPLEEKVAEIYKSLIASLDDESAFVRSWTISGLCILGRKHPEERKSIVNHLTRYERDPSIAVRHRVTSAIRFLIHDRTALPSGWVKSQLVREL